MNETRKQIVEAIDAACAEIHKAMDLTEKHDEHDLPLEPALWNVGGLMAVGGTLRSIQDMTARIAPRDKQGH